VGPNSVQIHRKNRRQPIVALAPPLSRQYALSEQSHSDKESGFFVTTSVISTNGSTACRPSPIQTSITGCLKWITRKGTVVRVKGIKRYRHPKTGKWHCCHRRSGARIESEFGSVEFFDELKKLEQAATPKRPSPGTLGHVIEALRRSSDWSSLRPATRKSYQRAIAVLRPIFEMPIT
jgi:hypothetical protein